MHWLTQLTNMVSQCMQNTYPCAIRLVQTSMVDVELLTTHRLPLECIGESFELVAAYEDGVLRAII